MNYFECVAANHGGGSSNTITITCDSGFAGVTLTCTDGNDTYTKVCPSVSPYTVDFENLAAGDWTISGTVQGTSYSKVVSISDSYATTLESGFSWATWVDLSQNYHSADYNSLADVFADEGALRELMTIHACCDYLIDAVTEDLDVIDDFCANDTAMKWIGLRDYVCDGLTAINGVEAKFLTSEYWERYLKDHVPTMTSNTAPYGEVVKTDIYGSNVDGYMAFDGNDSTYWYGNGGTAKKIGYHFTTPICVKRIYIKPAVSGTTSRVKTYKVQGSNDGTNWVDIYSGAFSSVDAQEVEIENSAYYMYYCAECNAANAGDITGVITLQFYGRSLNVSVPVMTSNTAPFGEASASGVYSSSPNYQPYKAFDGVSKSAYGIGWAGVQGVESGWIGYHFSSKTCVKFVAYNQRTQDTQGNFNRIKLATVEGSNGDSYESIYSIDDTGIPSSQVNVCHSFDSSKAYEDIRLNISTLQFTGTEKEPILLNLQFYGLDYSEREFEPNTNKKWLYDHGLELETFTTSGTVTRGDDYLTLSAANSEATATVDLTNYSILRGKVGDHMSGTTQLSVGGSNPAAATLTSDNAPNNNSLGISSFSQSLATGVKMTANGICDITELWVE